MLIYNANGPSGYRIANSLRFRSSASAYLNRTFGAGNQKTWTLSAWVKRGKLGADEIFFGQGTSTASSGYAFLTFTSTDTITIYGSPNDVSVDIAWTSTSVFRDPSAWYHIIAVLDTTQATASNRFKLYVNGVQQSGSFSTTPSQNADLEINRAAAHQIATGIPPAISTRFFDGYLADINFIDGQALTPSSFGETDATTGVWKPKAYTGSYGTNGFKLNFSNGTSTTTLGYDSSGNGDNWTTNNISLTSGSTYDWMIDSPTSYAGTSYGVGNYCVMNAVSIGSDCTLSNGNLGITYGSSATRNCTMGTIGMSSGKWYCEFSYTAGTTPSPIIGLSSKASSTDMPNYIGYNSYGWGYFNDGTKYTNATSSAYGATWTTNDVIGIAFDADAGTLTFYKNGTSQGTAFTGLTSGPYYFGVGDGSATSTFSGWINFGQRPFAFSPPSGYKSLCTYNLPTSTIQNGANHMAATTYTGAGAAQSISNSINGISYQPDFVWLKSRSRAGSSHYLYDSVRGVTKSLSSDSTGSEQTIANTLTSFNSDGFTLGSIGGDINAAGSTFVGWQWKANGTAVTNTAGSISSQVSANTTSGFSVATYTGAGGNSTVGHGLGVAPSMVIVKSRSTADAWAVYHASLGNTVSLYLQSTSASQTIALWNNTSPTSSVFTVSDISAGNGTVNWSGRNYVAYCFAAIAGYSAFGSFAGNASDDGPFVFTGFRPKWIMFKSATQAYRWYMFDSSRNTYNVMTSRLFANASDAEVNTGYFVDLLSNGFKVRTSDAEINGSGQTIIYAAFAENPFQNALAR